MVIFVTQVVLLFEGSELFLNLLKILCLYMIFPYKWKLYHELFACGILLYLDATDLFITHCYMNDKS